METLAPESTAPGDDQRQRPFVGEKIGPYRLVQQLGQGGMGTVFEAVHEHTQQKVALKLLTPAVRTTNESVKRFKRESQIAASINHPRSTFVYEAGKHGDQFYITMELMSGGTLKDVVAKEGPLPVAKAVDYVLDMIEGLQVAHDAGIVHRDLKPTNSFLDNDGRVKVGDFGLAKSFLGDSSLTQTGTFMGTPQFAAPEQLKSSDVDERADIYALGGTLFYLLSGRPPFTGNAAQVIASIASDIPPRVSQFVSGVPKALARLIAQTLEKDPERRPYNLHMLRDFLLPYSTRGALVADAGRRMAAYFFDFFVATLVATIFIMVLSPLALIVSGWLGFKANPQILGVAMQLPFMLLYFAVSESIWGRTIGKWMLGMRVVDQDGESPKFRAAIVRALLIPGTSLLTGGIISLFIVDPDLIGSMRDVMEMVFKSHSIGLLNWIPTLLLLSTARKENGYRGIHEILSGTRVVRLSGDLESKPLDRFEITAPTAVSDISDFPPYQILGRFREEASGEAVLLGKDPELDRNVWVFAGIDNGAGAGSKTSSPHWPAACY